MAKKKEPSKIPVNALERVAAEQFPATVTESWFDINVVIRRTLPLVEMLEFVKEVVESSFTESGSFVPEVIDFAVKSGVLTRYANFTLPEKLEAQYELIYNTGAFDMVLQYINMTQFNEIIGAINRKIKHLCDSDILTLRSKFTELLDALSNVQAQTASMFGGISPEDVKSLIGAVNATGTLSEDKIVDAYINKMTDMSDARVNTKDGAQ